MTAFLSFLQNDIFCTVLSSVLGALLLVLFGYVAFRLFCGPKSARLTYLKNYKKGRFAIIYAVAIPLYFLGLLHTAEQTSGAGNFIFVCFLNSVSSTLDLVKLDFGVGGLISYMVQNPAYYAVMVILYALTAVNFLLFSASFLWLRIKNRCAVIGAKRAKTLYVVVGDDPNCIVLMRSIRDSGLSGLLFASPDSKLKDLLFLEKLPYEEFDFRTENERAFGQKIEKLFGPSLGKGGPKKNVNVFLATGDEERNLLLTREMASVLDKKRTPSDGTLKAVEITAKEGLLKVYVFGELANRSAYSDYIEDSRAHIQYLNRYEMTAVDFVGQFPITRFMDEKQIDFGTGLIADSCEINVLFIGFGPTNRQIYQKLIADSQFFSRGRDGIYHKKLNCYIFDRAKAYRDKELNFGYFRYSQEFLAEDYPGHENDYLPLPDYPANDGTVSSDGTSVPWEQNTHFCEFDVHDRRSIRKLRRVFAGEGNVYTYVIVAFGEDLENVDFARNLSGLLYADRRQNAYLFAKVKSRNAYDALFDESHREKASGKFAIPIHPFGCTERIVYNIANITENPLDKLAKMKSFDFLRDYRKEDSTEERRRRALEQWANARLESRTSNFYCCLNLRLKLHLLGFDYAERDTACEDASDEFRKKYFGTDDPEEQERLRCQFKKGADGAFHYDPAVFTDGSLRTALARQEHQRWNACYLTQGIVPLSKTEIRKKIARDPERKLHGNLTTFEGLEEFRRLNSEVRAYDYKILDIADLLLQEAGFRIIKKKDERHK